MKDLLKNTAITGTVFVTMGSLIGSVFSYLLQIALGNLLSVEEFGTFSVFLSLTVIISIPATALSASLVKTVSEYLGKNDLKTLTAVFYKIVAFATVTSGVVFALVFLLKNPITNYIKTDNSYIYASFAVFVSLSFLHIIPASYLQGLLRFKAFAFYQAAAMFLRFSIPTILVLTGAKVGGVFAGMSVAMALTFLLGLALLKKNRQTNINQAESWSEPLKSTVYFAIPVLISLLTLNLVNNLDLILVRHFFDAYHAGVYAGALIMVKVLIFGTSTVQMVMYPVITNAKSRGDNYFKKMLQFLTLQIFILVVGALTFLLFPEKINAIMFSGKYVDSVKILPEFAVFGSLYVLCSFLVSFLLAISKTKVSLLLLPAAVAQGGLIYAFHSELIQVVRVNITVMSASLGILLIYLARDVWLKSKSESHGNSSSL